MAVQSISLFFPVRRRVKTWIYFYTFLIWSSSCFNASVTGQHRVIGPSQDVLVRVGEDVVLPCHIEPALDVEEMTVEWSRADLKPPYVHVLQDGRTISAKNPLYKRRTYLFDELLYRGNISLKLYRVKLADDGTFRCFVPTLGSYSDIMLRVGSVSEPVISSNGPTDGVLSLTCDSGCWHPQPEVSWLDGDGKNISAGPSVTDRPSQHCYEVQSNVTVRRPGQVTCRVHLPHFNYAAETHHVIPESDIPNSGSTGRGRPGMIVTAVMVTVAVAMVALTWEKKHTFTEEEKERRDRASRLRGLLERTPGYLHITDLETQLQHNMKSTYLSVQLGTDPEIVFENVFTPLYNVDIKLTDIHSHHVVRQMEMRKAGEGTEIQFGQIFKDLSGLIKRTVLTVGFAGIGKTFLVHKFVSDWAKKCFPQDPHLVFPLQFRQLNLLKGQEFSLAQLIHHCIAETRFIEEDILNHIFNTLQKSGDYNDIPFKVMFVMDGYDENNFQFDFRTDFGLMNVNDSYPVEVLLVNLIKGKLLPSAHMWITSRPVAANQIPKEFVNRMTEVRGFIRDEQKKEFFTKTISDENQASSIFSHIKTSKILHTMCEIPVFCWILATVVKYMGTTARLPKTLVELFCHFLMGETLREKMKNAALGNADKNKLIKDAGKVLLKLGRLAFHQLAKGNIIFYEEDLKACGLDVNVDLKNLGFCTKFFKEDNMFFEQTVYCFVHLSIQEFLAAFYLFHCFTQRNVEVLKTFLGNDYNSDSSMSDFLEATMRKILQSESGHLDLFVRFLHGLSLESNQSLLGGLLSHTENNAEEIQRAINNLKEMNDDDFSPDRCINIFHCLMEMNDPSLRQGIQQYLDSESRSGNELTVPQCSALVSLIQMSEEVLEELDLDKFNASEEGRRRLLSAVPKRRKARLVGFGRHFTREHIEVVASALSSNPSHLQHLDLSYNVIPAPLLDLLCEALKSPNCRLETLRLMNCWLSERSCEGLASALSSNPSHLRELDLTFNVLPVSGLKNFSGLESLTVKHGGELWTNPQLLTQYFHRLTLDPNTASTTLRLSEDNRKVQTRPNREELQGEELQSYPDHAERFDDECRQILCKEGLSGHCYLWLVEWSGEVWIGVTYGSIIRKGEAWRRLGDDDNSMCLWCYEGGYAVGHGGRFTDLPIGPSGSHRVAVYVDYAAGTLSFYDVSSESESLTHLHTIRTTFKEPLYPGFRLSNDVSSVCLCEDR